MATKTIQIYTKENPRKEIIRDGIYVKPIDGDFNRGYQDDAYLVDFFGNIFYQKEIGASKELCDSEQLNKAEKEGFHCVRNLTDSEIFYMDKKIKSLA